MKKEFSWKLTVRANYGSDDTRDLDFGDLPEEARQKVLEALGNYYDHGEIECQDSPDEADYIEYLVEDCEGGIAVRKMQFDPGTRPEDIFHTAARMCALGDLEECEVTDVVIGGAHYHYGGWMPGMHITFYGEDDVLTYEIWMPELDH